MHKGLRSPAVFFVFFSSRSQADVWTPIVHSSPASSVPKCPSSPILLRAGQRAHASQVSLMSSCSFGEERQLCSSVTSFCSLRAAGFGVLQTKRQPAGRSHGSVRPPTRAPIHAASKDSCGHRKTVGLPARIDAEPPPGSWCRAGVPTPAFLPTPRVSTQPRVQQSWATR